MFIDVAGGQLKSIHLIITPLPYMDGLSKLKNIQKNIRNGEVYALQQGNLLQSVLPTWTGCMLVFPLTTKSNVRTLQYLNNDFSENALV